MAPPRSSPGGRERVKVLFYRDFKSFSGGHLKVWDYFNHVLSSADHEPFVRFSRNSVWDETNPWVNCRERVVGRWSRLRPDVLFLGGLDWLSLSPKQRRSGRRPIINLIQHVDHAEPNNARYSFLSHRAIRICVSEEISAAIAATGQVNGPVLTIPDAIDGDALGQVPRPDVRDLDVLVVANKRPHIGRRLFAALDGRGVRINVLDQTIRRSDFLALLARSRVALFVPNTTEGFYLPALEAMALGTVVVCPDCVGNRSFCISGHNSYRPDFADEPMIEDVMTALQQPTSTTEAMVANARATANAHDLKQERRAFLQILADVDRLWAST